MTGVTPAGLAALGAYADGLEAVVAAVAAVPIDPLDAVRILVPLASYQPQEGASSASAATAALCRRLALVQLIEIVPTIAFSAYDDCEAAMTLVTGLLDAEIDYAGDHYEDAVVGQLGDLRALVVASLTRQGADLAPLIDRTFRQELPAAVVAQMLYGTGERADEIMARTDAPHPGFQPTTMRVLAR